MSIDALTSIQQSLTAVRATKGEWKEARVVTALCVGATTDSCYHLMDIGLSDFGEVIGAGHNHGTESAGAKAIHGLQSELVVFGRFSRLYTETLFEFADNQRRTTNMAGCAKAYGDEVLPSGFEAERVIKCGESKNVDQWSFRLLCDQDKCVLGQVAILGLDLFEDRCDCAVGSLVLLYDPAGKAFERMEGARETSTSKVYGAIDKLWTASFKVKSREFARKMDSILDKLDKVEEKLIAVEIKKRRAAGSASRLAAVDREEAKLEKEEKELLEDQKKLIADVELREEITAGETAEK